MIVMSVGEMDSVESRRLGISLASVLIFLGFASIAFYMGSTIFYPMLEFNEFLGFALHGDMREILVHKYVGYLPLMIFGIISVIAGNIFWHSKKRIDNIIFMMTCMILFTAFVALLLKTVP